VPRTTATGRTITAIAAVALAAGAGLIAAPAASAEAPFDACAYLAGSILNANTYSQASYGTDLKAGQVITVSASQPTGGAASIWMQSNSSPVASAGIPGTMRYTIPSTGPIFLAWGADTGTALWSARCSDPSSPTPMWEQGTGRAAADEACADGWAASWAQWPNDGKGGWVCVRSVLMYGAE
jgi:hypothetical protein